jgi:hypothetical protein
VTPPDAADAEAVAFDVALTPLMLMANLARSRAPVRGVVRFEFLCA